VFAASASVARDDGIAATLCYNTQKESNT